MATFSPQRMSHNMVMSFVPHQTEVVHNSMHEMSHDLLTVSPLLKFMRGCGRSCSVVAEICVIERMACI